MKTPLSPAPDKQASSLPRRLEHHFMTCSALVGAAGAALSSAPAANAEIVFHPMDVQIPLNDELGIYFNLETGGFATDESLIDLWDINIFNYPGLELSTYALPDVGVIGYPDPAYPAFFFANRLDQSDPIDGTSPFVMGGFTTMSLDAIYGQWVDDVSGFLGVSFQLESGDQVFGWIGIDVVDSVEARVTGIAYETTGAPIAAGAIPEPSSLALCFLAAGAGGLAVWRRRKSSTVS